MISAFAPFSASPGMTHGAAVPRFLLRRIAQGAPQPFFKRKNLPLLGGSAFLILGLGLVAPQKSYPQPSRIARVFLFTYLIKERLGEIGLLGKLLIYKDFYTFL